VAASSDSARDVLFAAALDELRDTGRLRDLLERLQEGIVTVNAELEVDFANNAARRLFEPASLEQGTPLPDRWPALRLRALAARLFEPGARPAETEAAVGPAQTLRIAGLPAHGTSEAVLVVSDVSARERRERAEREFVENAAHELRTPLTAISGAVDALQRGAKEDPDQREQFLAHIERECVRLIRLTEALLVLARVDMGVEDARRDIVELRPLLDQVGQALRTAREVRVEIECDPGLAVVGHRELLQQALTNLAANAAKNTQRGTISLRGAQNGRKIVLEVADSGVGMSPEERTRATERFFRAGDQPGSGLGLAIVSRAALALGGELVLESAQGQGTTARVILPAVQDVELG
jgi:signal transduction histidine kinase